MSTSRCRISELIWQVILQIRVFFLDYLVKLVYKVKKTTQLLSSRRVPQRWQRTFQFFLSQLLKLIEPHINLWNFQRVSLLIIKKTLVVLSLLVMNIIFHINCRVPFDRRINLFILPRMTIKILCIDPRISDSMIHHVTHRRGLSVLAMQVMTGHWVILLFKLVPVSHEVVGVHGLNRKRLIYVVKLTIFFRVLSSSPSEFK